MHGRKHPNYWQITILLVVDLCSSLAYFMMTQPLPIASKLPTKTLVAKQLPTYKQFIQLLCSCIVDGRSGRRVPSSELKDHFPSDGCEHTTTTSGVEQEIHIRKKVVGTSVIDNSRKKPAVKGVCFSTSPRRKPKSLCLSSSS